MALVVKHCIVDIDNKNILQNVSFEIQAGETVAIIGPSGSGKTTLLRCIAGLQHHTGTLEFNGERLDILPTERRNIGMVDQRLNLFPHLTVFQNIAYPLRIRNIPLDQLQDMVMATLKEFQIEHTRHQLPQTLSGGEQQRVALARSIIYNPRLLLLDEPFAGLDSLLKYDLVMWLKSMLAKNSMPTLLVTHDIREAKTLSQRAIILMDGSVVAFDTWEALERSTISSVSKMLSKAL